MNLIALAVLLSLRAPALPLINIDPFTNAWSTTDKLYDSPTIHWCGKACPLVGIAEVDGVRYRFMGVDGSPVALAMGKWEAYDNVFEQSFIFDGEASDPVFLRFSCRGHCRMFLNGTEIFDMPHDHYGTPVELYLEGSRRELLKQGANMVRFENQRTLDACQCTLEAFRWTPATRLTAWQKSSGFTATQTRYSFACGPVDLDLRFTAPLLADDLELISRPVNYISYGIRSNDGAKHSVTVSIEASADCWTVNTDGADVIASGVPFSESGLSPRSVRIGRSDQQPLSDCGDNCTIDWGWLYLSVPYTEGASKSGFSTLDDRRAVLVDAGFDSVRKASGHFLLSYDDVRSVRYFGEDLLPYWNRDSTKTILDEIAAAEDGYESLLRRCDAFDRRLFRQAKRAGGEKYAELCALAYRQCIASHKLVELPSGRIGFFSKECDSNGSIGTVDVTYPSAPLFLKYNPELCKGLINFIFEYCEGGGWEYPSAPHDVGCYPWAEGQGYPLEMFVEESGNLLLLTAAICSAGKDWSYAGEHWEVLTTWCNYLRENGLDPVNQLCTDDFAGHLAHNANLSAKAILGIAAYAQMAERLGLDCAPGLMSEAREMADQWVSMADDGDHYRLAFDRPGSWSLKYNLVWDRKLGLDVFPAEVARKELDWYRGVTGRYGIPLDSRQSYTKSDWIVWTACLADSRREFESMIEPLWDYYNETPARVPMTDWYYTDVANYCMFKSRTVVGAYFMKML